MEEFYDTNVDLIGWKEETGLVQMEKNVAECVYQMYTLYPSLDNLPTLSLMMSPLKQQWTSPANNTEKIKLYISWGKDIIGYPANNIVKAWQLILL